MRFIGFIRSSIMVYCKVSGRAIVLVGDAK